MINGKTIDEINILLAEASQADREQFEKEQEEAEAIDLLSERIAAEEFERYALENDLSYEDVSKGW
jgi:hypothetical protein